MHIQWTDLSPHWSRLVELSDARNAQKRGFDTAHYYNGVNSNLFGCAGEKLVSLETGLPMNEDLLISGDGGRDFPFTNVHATQYWDDPWLKEFQNPKHRVPFYILAAIDVECRCGWLPGFTTANRLFAAPLRDWGHGPRHSIRHDDPAIYPMKQYLLAVAWHKDLGAAPIGG